MKNMVLALIVPALTILTGCAHEAPVEKEPSPKVEANGLPKDWTAAMRIMVDTEGARSVESIHVFERHPKSIARSIYFGVNQNGGFRPKCEMEVYRVKKAAWEKVLNSKVMNFDELGQNANAILKIKQELRDAGQKLGSISNQSGDKIKPAYFDGPAALMGYGVAPRVSVLPSDLKADDMIVVLEKITRTSAYEGEKTKEKKVEKVRTMQMGTLNIYPAKRVWFYTGLPKRSKSTKIVEIESAQGLDSDEIGKGPEPKVFANAIGAEFSDLPADTKIYLKYKMTR